MKDENLYFKKSSLFGFTLVEVLVSFTVGVIFLAVFTQSYQIFVQNIKKTQEKILRLYAFQNDCVCQQDALIMKSKDKRFDFPKNILILKRGIGVFIKIFFHDEKRKDSFVVVFRPMLL